MTLARAAARGRRQDRHRLLPRQAARRHAPAVGRRLHLGARQPRQPLDRDHGRGARRQRLVAAQGLPGRRARQPAHRDHRARLDDGRVERAAAEHDAQRRRHHHLRVVRRRSDQQLRRRRERRRLRALHRHARRRGGEADARLLAAGLSPRRGAAAVAAGDADAARASSTGSARIPGTPTATSSWRRRTSGWSTRAPSPTATISRTGTWAATSRARAWGSSGTSSSCTRARTSGGATTSRSQDHADMWVHEGFANYAEGLYTECQLGQDGRRGVPDRAPEADPQRPADHRPLRRQRRRLGRHVPQGRQPAAHDPPDRGRRREVARHPPRPQPRPSGTRRSPAGRSRTTSAARRAST